MRTNYILIDYENVQPGLLPTGSDIPIKVLTFIGERQTKIPFELASSLQKLGDQASYIKIDGNGPDALDFHIAYYIGKLAEQDSNSYFHIVSKDKGFDPLIRHLKKNKILIQRVNSLSEILILSNSNNSTLGQKVTSMIESLKARGNSRPRRVKTLENTINAFFMKSLSEAEVKKIVAQLAKQKAITLTDQVVSYNAPITGKD